MKRYVLFSRSDERVTAILKDVASDLDLQIVDESGARAVLAEATEEAVAELRNRMPDWVISEEAESRIPSPFRPTIAKRRI